MNRPPPGSTRTATLFPYPTLFRSRIENVLDAARAKGFRGGENPARWRGHLDQLLPKRQRLSRGHHTALAYDAIPTFMVSLDERPAMAARALAFTILTAARSGEAIGRASVREQVCPYQ